MSINLLVFALVAALATGLLAWLLALVLALVGLTRAAISLWEAIQARAAAARQA